MALRLPIYIMLPDVLLRVFLSWLSMFLLSPSVVIFWRVIRAWRAGRHGASLPGLMKRPAPPQRRFPAGVAPPRANINIRAKPETRHRYVTKYALRRGLRQHATASAAYIHIRAIAALASKNAEQGLTGLINLIQRGKRRARQ